MYRNVLVGIDKRDGSRDALALARALAPHYERMSLINVRDMYYPGMRAIAPDEDAAESGYSLDLLRTIRNDRVPDAEMLSVSATSVGAGMKDAAAQIGADLIVVGSCQRSAIGRTVSGNDATATLHQAPCAVAIAPRGYATSGGAITTIGVAYDGSPQSAAALAATRLLAIDVAAPFRALDVEEVKVGGYGWVAPFVEARDILISNAQRRLGDIAGARLEVVVGLTREELVRFSDEVDVLVCGSRSRGALKRVILSSTSDYLVRHARSPMVIVPAVADTADSGAEEELASATR